MRTITEIILHCSATREGQDVSAETIRKFHTMPESQGGRGWSDIGYHYVIRLDGTIEKGRDESVIGAHTTGHNAHSIGVCYVGGLDKNNKPKDTRTQAQKDALCDLLRRLVVQYPNAKIYGHNEFANKACPCFDATQEYSII